MRTPRILPRFSVFEFFIEPFLLYSWWAVGSALIGVVGGAINNNQAKKAAQGIAGKADQLTYTPIDLNKIRKDAADAAAENAAASLNLERSLQPDVAAARSGVAKSINDQLALGGRIPADVANQVAMAARTAGGVSGGFGGTPGVTAATLGTTALNLINQRQGNALALTTANPLPVAGLDPGSIASAEIADNNARNQFEAAKLGVQSNLINSNAQMNSAGIGSATSALSSLASLYGRQAVPVTTTTAPTATLPTFNSQVAPINTSLYGQPYNAQLIPGG